MSVENYCPEIHNDYNDITDERTIASDLSWGEKQEIKLKTKIEECLGFKLEKTEQYDTFDFVNTHTKTFVELKSRTNKKNKYPTTMIGNNKWEKSLLLEDKGWTIYYFFNFTDELCYYEFDGKDNIEKKRGGRCDRGRAEIKYYRYIPIDKLINSAEKLN